MIRFLMVIWLCPLIVTGQSDVSLNKPVLNGISYPVPTENPDMLFYLQRSLDSNSVIYAANYLDVKGGYRKLKSDQPVNIYWLINDKTGTTKPLSKVQKLGYGIRSEDLENEIVQLRLIAYREMAILLKPSLKDDRYHAHVVLEGKDIILTRVFINIDGGTKLKPNVTYIEIAGTESQTGKKIVHKFKP